MTRLILCLVLRVAITLGVFFFTLHMWDNTAGAVVAASVTLVGTIATTTAMFCGLEGGDDWTVLIGMMVIFFIVGAVVTFLVTGAVSFMASVIFSGIGQTFTADYFSPYVAGIIGFVAIILSAGLLPLWIGTHKRMVLVHWVHGFIEGSLIVLPILKTILS